jgi:large subunit ribosomal protein L24
MEIRSNDTVEVLNGEDGGTRGKVLRIDRKAGKLVVEGVATVHKHVRRSQKNPQGGRLRKEMPIPIAKVKLVCPACNAATRVGVRIQEDGAKFRYCKKCGASIGEISPAKGKRKD